MTKPGQKPVPAPLDWRLIEAVAGVIVLAALFVVAGTREQKSQETRDSQQAELGRLVRSMPAVVRTQQECACGPMGSCRCCACSKR